MSCLCVSAALVCLESELHDLSKSRPAPISNSTSHDIWGSSTEKMAAKSMLVGQAASKIPNSSAYYYLFLGIAVSSKCDLLPTNGIQQKMSF